MIPPKPNPNIKSYCYKSPGCNVVETGAVQSRWFVCTDCKEEVTEELKNKLENKAEDQVELDLEDSYYGWGSGNTWTP